MYPEKSVRRLSTLVLPKDSTMLEDTRQPGSPPHFRSQPCFPSVKSTDAEIMTSLQHSYLRAFLLAGPRPRPSLAASAR